MATGPAGVEMLARALAARHTDRITNMSRVPQETLEKCYQYLYRLHAISAASVDHRNSPLLLREASQPPDHIGWGALGAMAAIRLLIAGQVVGAAILVQQQLGRWTLLLANREPGPMESAVDLMAWAWTQGAVESLGKRTADVLAEGRFDDIDEPMMAGSTPKSFRRIRLADGRRVCPASICRELSQIKDATMSNAATSWECLDILDSESISSDIESTVLCICDGLELCLLNLWHGSMKSSIALRQSEIIQDPWYRASFRSTVERLDRRFSASHSKLEEILISSLTPMLTPLTLLQLVSDDSLVYLADHHEHYRTEYASSPSAAIDRPTEIAKLALAAHRYIRYIVAEDEHESDLTHDAMRPFVFQHLSYDSAYILTAELAALCARWNSSRSELATAAMLISSTLRSAYWLWLDRDDRAMGILRSTLQQAARLKTWRTNSRLARQLESMTLTSHGDWLKAAGWPEDMGLDLVLFEFAHANPDSGPEAAEDFFDDGYEATRGSVRVRLARQLALDQVTELAAAETVQLIAAQQSLPLANAARELLVERGLHIPHITSHSTFPYSDPRPSRHEPATNPRQQVGAMDV
jgi:hypothetical protein